MIAPHADVVGMTIAAECVIAGELGLEYAALCMVDNLANGLAEGELSVDEMEADRIINAARLRDGLAGVLPRLARSADERGRPVVIGARTLDGETVGLRCADDGTVAALGPAVVAAPGEEALDADGAILVPPLINGHTHAAMTLFRGSGGDLPLMPWLEERIWPVEAKLEPEDVYWGTRLACLEMIRSGTTRFWDMYWHPEATARAVADAGIRATIGAPFFDRGRDVAAMRTEAVEHLDALSAFGGPVTAALAPHSIYMVSEESLRFIAELSTKRDAPVQIHPPRRSPRSTTASANTACAPPPTSTASAC